MRLTEPEVYQVDEGRNFTCHVLTHTHTHTFPRTCTNTRMHTHTHTHISTHVHTHTRMHTHTHFHARAQTHTCTHTHTYTHTLMQTHTHVVIAVTPLFVHTPVLSHRCRKICLKPPAHVLSVTHTHKHTHTYIHTFCTYVVHDEGRGGLLHIYRPSQGRTHTHAHTHIQTCMHSCTPHIHMRAALWCRCGMLSCSACLSVRAG